MEEPTDGVASGWEPCATTRIELRWVACPRCHAENVEAFRFCSLCGYARRWRGTEAGLGQESGAFPDEIPIEEAAIQERFRALQERFQQAKGREKVKDRHLSALEDFLWRLQRPGGLASANPRDVIDYLIHCDLVGNGRTIIHDTECKNVGSTSNDDCSCASRLSFATVRSYMFALRSAFTNAGRVGNYDAATGSGNPTQSQQVDLFIGWLKEEQCKAGVTSKKAPPLLLDKLRRMCKLLDAVAHNSGASQYARLAAARDKAWYTVAFHSAVRNGQLGSTLLTRTAYRDAEKSAIFLNYCWGKNLRDGSVDLICLQRLPVGQDGTAPLICPVASIEEWVAAARRVGWPMSVSGGYLFADIDTKTLEAVPGPANNTAQAARFVKQLKEWDMYDGETLHGTRSGATASVQMAGADEATAQALGNWKTAGFAEHYGSRHLMETASGKSMSNITAREYRELSNAPTDRDRQRALAL